ncbi:MAG TPA: hypothetical protein VNF68_03420 [Candidatus Baltobacteraceae bacterium]|nr:hypothetical protein [Candidatus Baltobacteraceae bacterium]
MSGHGRRGQALIETIVFLPVTMLVLFGIIYFARLGVLSERSQSAVRYGTLVSYNGSSVYSAADIYAGLSNSSGPAPVCPSSVVSDITSAVTHANAPLGSATPVPLWNPDMPASATCTVSILSFTGRPFEASHFLTVTQETVTAGLKVPSYLQSFLGSSNSATASLGFLHSDPPSVILYCVGSLGSAVAQALQSAYGGGGSC